MNNFTGANQHETAAGNVQVGDPAPDFTLLDENGQPVHFADLLGKSEIVLYFYPKDNSMGCTAEACAFRDSYEVFKKAGAIVVGVSSDTAESHQGFAEKHHLPFTLLSDAKAEVQKLYGVPKTLGLFSGRVTYIIDRQGIVRHRFSSQINIDKHITDALQVIQKLHDEPV
ncbi:MAG: peroxiredoxin [Chloroflexota bacterium]